MSLNVEPFIKTPFTDIVGLTGHHQHFGRCHRFEMWMMECLEAYGHDKGQIRCRDIIDDFNECHTQNKQKARETAMRLERHKQVLKGQRAWRDHYAPPGPTDAY